MTEPETTEAGRKGFPREVADRLADALAALGTGAYLVDEKGHIVAVNPPAERLLDRPSADLLGHDAHDRLHRTSRGEPMARSQCGMRQTFHAGETSQGEQEWFERGDGSLLSISWLITPYDIGDGHRGTLVLFRPSDSAPTARDRADDSLSPFERLALLAETTTRLTSTLDVDEALDRLVALVVPRLADWAVVDLITERDEVRRAVVVHHEEGALVTHEELQGPMPPVPEESPMPLSRALRGVASTLAGPRTYQGPPDSGIAVEQRRLFEATGIHSAAIAPLRSTREVLGALTLGRSERPAEFTTADLALLEDIARRAGLAVDNARLYQRQRAVAETMQRHLLPQMPGVPGVEMAVRYLPAPDASHVGGDWYDAFTLADGATALAVGDVVGHDLDAAAGMAQVRNMLRAYAWSQEEPPSRIVERLDDAVLHITEVPMATMIFARMAEGSGGRYELSWTNAGHPPPLLVTRSGLARYLTDGHDILLGTGARRSRPDATLTLPPGSTLVLYTDGLIESPRRSLDEGLDRLRRHAASLAHRPLESFTDRLLERSRPADNDDDVAVLALRTPGEVREGAAGGR
ncbi:SpoIIE family protein phosphatase [Streptomyces sp. NPDC088812]|uniref:SpoIIE family protein phosphatase n=1 Tax=Streptomyces sp. NPDC088812 TaxID=3365905 RepID=UPI0038294DA2